MRYARRLRQQLDDWQQMWRQVEAFVDRVEAARDEDAGARRKTDALLAAAGAIERRQRVAGLTPVALGDPVVDQLPTHGWDAQQERDVAVPLPWAGTSRQARLPGNDDAEAAVADLATLTPPFLEELSGALVKNAVRLVSARDTFAVEVDGVLDTLRVPSYPGLGQGIVTVAEADLEVASLFSADDRHAATLATLDPQEDAPPFVRTWSWLTTQRRAAVLALDPKPPLSSVGGPTGANTAGVPLTAALLHQAAACVADALAGRAVRLSPGVHRTVADNLAAAAAAAATAGSPDAAALRASARVLDDEGIASAAEGLVEDLGQAADAVAASPEALTAVAEAAGALAAALATSPPGPTVSAAVQGVLRGPAEALEVALDALPGAGTLPALLVLPVELGGVAVELDTVLAERVAHPDGSLRILRTLEIAFARWWPSALRWMAVRAQPGRSLDRALRRFTDPFVTSLAALVQGSDTGLGVEGLSLGEPGNVSAALLVCDAPASLATTVARTVEAGQVAVLPAERPAAAVLLGVGSLQDRLALQIAPLRVSLVPPDLGVPGSPGLVATGTPLADRGTPISPDELRRGFAVAPERDGVVEQVVALYSQLALVLGRSALTARLAGVTVPDPPGPVLSTISWHGEVAPMTAAFVLHGVPEAWWDRGAGTPVPRFARPGELLLLRGPAPPDPDGVSAGVLQTVVEVDRTVWLSGAMLDRIDTTRAALLATDPAVLADIGGPTIVCGPTADLALLTVRRTWQVDPVQGPLTFRRDFAGFDLPSLAVGRPLGDELVRDITGVAPPGPAGVDRSVELAAALGLLDDWTRHARPDR